MTSREQGYVHYAECCESLRRALLILKDLRGIDQRTAIQDAAFRFALVEYGKPYHRQENAESHGRQIIKVGPPMLPLADLVLHREILAFRDQVLARSEMTLEDAMAVSGGDGWKPRGAAENERAPLFPGIDAMIGLIERSLGKMEEERAELLESANASRVRHRIILKAVKVGIQTFGVLAGLAGFYMAYLMVFTIYRSMAEGRSDAAAFAFVGFLFSAYLICFGYFASFQYSPIAVRHLCAVLAVCALGPMGKLIDPSDDWRHLRHPEWMAFAHLASLASVYLVYRFVSGRLNRFLFSGQA